ncbi:MULTISPECIES: 5-methyltetrahydropteroyltriglutamate--homocysteine S-methyltransferase [unclassified Streptococcus]|uniref:5-methyltetrahydropteroyltriglutamate-- homocysteine S-methyltransferase n=1 Tax=unclassified Streptococcus TaxID=2608887 RepID=UPI001072796F|nr:MULTISPECIES: 5-methyltetrahydropteroyltriglutamate--homocysteine S-methyltransferase [unclassified Streptococcus]MBF0787573.1 5-methyltetrahydropteroyltriglutamate--homocysteine S-methyltransferase [Streptococcus sp. 19428wC2_LYSM12]MCQ9211960.1 5-methyltetrahydropteroyltriglutamate--homocysteine S-methyltransferase [Streptococcus sp. B01]MCQ9213289.1 5-methyltetrahydropteroyltriglutamate--homocysteine S-methyltransferase [Streptococcus sp. O1]TFV05417.1 5-methyltetrahydropteroyltriglutamat
MVSTIIGFPRLGEFRELKFTTEKYFRGEIDEAELLETAKHLRSKHWNLVKKAGITEIPSNDFSHYDNVLDTAFLLNVVPKAVRDLDLTELECYFALSRGYQGEKGDVRALPMKKWFNTNYHYIVPKFEKDTQVRLASNKIFDEFSEAKAQGIHTRPVLIGPFTFLQLADYEAGTVATDFVESIVATYQVIFEKLAELGADTIQLDEPSLVKDISAGERALFLEIYNNLLADKKGLSVLVQTYFGDVRDVYSDLINLQIDGLGLDFVEGKKTLDLVSTGFPTDKVLYAGIVNGKNIWRNNYEQSLAILKKVPADRVVLNTSCSLLHVPFTTENEELDTSILQHFAFAVEKLAELCDLDTILANGGADILARNKGLFEAERVGKNAALATRIADLREEDYSRFPIFTEREKLQAERLKLPVLPTTSIGSFPQTEEVRASRLAFHQGELSAQAYDEFLAKQIDDWINWQEEVGFDVLVHGEFERNDMVEYFGQNLSGYLFSKNGWVQSYGMRGVKPPIIWGDITRLQPITVKWSSYAQSRTAKPVKGMLTGPVTILNWSFPREDISIKESTLQIALAIKEEVHDLETAGIKIIQIDEAALREKLPLRKSDWYEDYLDWAIPAFRLVHSTVAPDTQIHTHMCYSEFIDIIPAIDNMDADVISFEASRSNLVILDELKAQNFQTQVGPGVYDIHSPRIPAEREIDHAITAILTKVPSHKVWINPDCGLKTRGIKETRKSLSRLVKAAKAARQKIKQ